MSSIVERGLYVGVVWLCLVLFLVCAALAWRRLWPVLRLTTARQRVFVGVEALLLSSAGTLIYALVPHHGPNWVLYPTAASLVFLMLGLIHFE